MVGEDRILSERAYRFLEVAKYLMNKEYYDLAIFNMEQFCQLILKSKLLRKVGTYPRTHSLLTLINALNEAVGGELSEFIERETIYLSSLEDAYIVSRYLPREYGRREAEMLFSFIERFEERMRNV